MIFKCQDTIDGGKQYLTHVEIVNMATQIGFYVKDMFILLAKNRVVDVPIDQQQHCRKFHCYYLAIIKKPSKVKYSVATSVI